MAKSTTHPPADSEESQVRMSFGEHLEELRKRIIRSLVGSIAGIMLCFYYSNTIVEFLLRPYRLALLAHHYPQYFHYSQPAEPVIIYLTIGLKAGLVLSSPLIIYQLWQFVAAGLYPRERRVVYRYIGPSAVLFLAGVAFFYFLVLPMTLNFFVGFTDNTATTHPQPTWLEKTFIWRSAKMPDLSKLPPGDKATLTPIPVVSSDPPRPPDGAGYLYFNAREESLKFITSDGMSVVLTAQAGSLFANVPSFDDYLTFVTWTGVIFGLAFEMPMVMLVIAQIGLVQPATYRKSRKYAYFGLLIVSMIIAPSPDVITPLTFFIPLIGLYEAGVIAATIIVQRQERAPMSPGAGVAAMKQTISISMACWIACVALSALATPLLADSWPFTPTPDSFAPDAVVDLRSLNEKTAGETGFVTRTKDGNDFALSDGRAMRFWAVNDANGDLPMAQLEHHARWLAKRGVNMVRLHTQISPEKGRPFLEANPKELDRVFKTVAAMKKEGIYCTISPYWAYVKIPDAWQIPGVGKDQQAWGYLFWDERLQEGYKAWTKKLLTTPNPYTGVPLCKEPAVAILQIQNEDSMLFWTMQNIKGVQLDNLRRKFAAFLAKKYGLLEAAQAAWPRAKLPDDKFAENLPAMYITWELTLPQTGDKQKRLADQAEFLTESMKNFNAMIGDYFRKELGCRQLINAGNWQTASATRLYDLERYSYTANEVIGVNRYFSGIHKGDKDGWAIDPGDHFTNASVLKDPRALPLNIKQVAGFPTIVSESEWVNPDLYQSEGPFLVAAYSSLTGVDAFYWFSIGDGPEWQQPFRDPVNGWQAPMSKWNVGTPMQFGQFPAAAILFRNRYLQEAAPVVREERTVQQLWARDLPLIAEDQSYDPNRNAGDAGSKSAALSVDPLAFLVGPVTVTYSDPANRKSKTENRKSPDLATFINHDAKTITSATKEVTLNYATGFCTINAPCAQGATGFLKAAGPIRLADITLRVENDYATVLVVSLDKLPLAQSKNVLVQIGTTERPMNWKDHPLDFTSDDKKTTYHGFQVDSTGQNPWQIEDAHGTLTLTNPRLAHATLLDPNLTPNGPLALTREGATVKLALPEKALYVLLSE